MKIEYRDGLLFVSLTLEYEGRTQIIDNVILDTGAAQSLIDTDAADTLSLETDDDDIIVPMVGIGGIDYSVRKQIDSLVFGSYHLKRPTIDFGNLGAHPGVNGLLGSDILVQGRFVIDLDKMEVYQA